MKHFKLFNFDYDDSLLFISADEVANYVFNTTGDWMLAHGVREECKEAEIGDVFNLEFYNMKIHCIDGREWNNVIP